MTFRTKPSPGRNDFTDEQSVRDWCWHPGPGERVLDVGAAIGSYALPALAAGARVVAFSPDKQNTEDLVANLALNAGFTERCDVRRHGLYSRSGWMRLNDSKTRYIFSSVPPPVSAEPFFVCRLDGLAPMSVDWMKIDVEGAELEVLRGAELSIREHRPRLLVECHQFMDPTLADAVTDFVLGLDIGYQGESRPHHSVVHSFFEVK